MLKKLRRNNKQLVDRRRSSVATVGSIPDPTISNATSTERKHTFFDLPAEIRNDIYEHVACDTRIFLPLPDRKSNKSTPLPIPSLLIASRQLRNEFLPLLLECAHIAVVIRNFDFRNLMRISSSLYSTELKALRNNERLTIRLLVEKCNRESIASLRRWLVKRAEGLDRLAWNYSIGWSKHTQLVPTSTQVHRINVYIQRRTLLNQNLESMAQLHHNVEDTLKFELDPIITTFERELAHVSADPNPDLPWSHESQYMGYGVRWGSSNF